MALWGNKNDDDPDRPVSQNGDSSSHVVLPRASEADERTRLLPPPSQGYLSPDDPAVSSPSSAFQWPLNCTSEKLISLTSATRYHLTTSGAFDSYATLRSSSQS